MPKIRYNRLINSICHLTKIREVRIMPGRDGTGPAKAAKKISPGRKAMRRRKNGFLTGLERRRSVCQEETEQAQWAKDQ
jgi:hypothetical protein